MAYHADRTERLTTRTLVAAANHEGEADACVIEEAVDVLRQRQPVALPAETVYGLAADALKAEAVARIFQAKERPFFDPLIVHVAEASWLERLAEMDSLQQIAADRLVQTFWPGPLTLVLPRRDKLVPDLATSGLPTVALRCPAHPVFQQVLRAFGGPLAAPSANRFGRISPTTAAHVRAELDGRIPLILDGGPCPHGIESTIVAVSGESVRILRQGPVSREQLREALDDFPSIEILEKGHENRSASALDAPGQLASHYAPVKPLRLVDTTAQVPADERGRAGFLGFSRRTHDADESTAGFAEVRWLTGDNSKYRNKENNGENQGEESGAHDDLITAAARLFALVRELDDSAKVEIIYAGRLPPKLAAHGLAQAIMDRLRRAEGR